MDQLCYYIKNVPVLSEQNILATAKRLEVTSHISFVLAESLFTENLISDIKKHRHLFNFMLNNNQSQLEFLDALENIVENYDLYDKTLQVLKLIHITLIKDSVLLSWTPKTERMFWAAEPFLIRLRYLNEESGESSS
jgi:hypothetical protein